MLKPALLLAALMAAGLAHAADPLTEAMQQAYAPYRNAMFKLNSGDQEQARQAVTKAQQSWAGVAAQFGAKPPVPYDQDAALTASLAEVGDIYAKVASEVEANQLPQAHATLKQVSRAMADIRQRSNVVTFTDHVNAYHVQMEKVLIDGPKLLQAADGKLQLMAQVGALDYLAQRLQTQAPALYLQNPEFKALQAALAQSVADLKVALLQPGEPDLKAVLASVKTSYSKLFAKFG